MSNSLRPHGLYNPYNSLGQKTGVGSLFFLQGIFPTQGLNSGLPDCKQILYQLSHRGSLVGPITSWRIDGETVEMLTDFICLQPWNLKGVHWKKNNDKARQYIKKQRHYFSNKGLSSFFSFSSSHVWMWELDHKEGWVLKNWCFWIVVLEKSLESPSDSKEINSKGNQFWIVLGGLMMNLKLQYFGHLMWRADLLEKTLMLGKIEGRKRRR